MERTISRWHHEVLQDNPRVLFASHKKESLTLGYQELQSGARQKGVRDRLAGIVRVFAERGPD